MSFAVNGQQSPEKVMYAFIHLSYLLPTDRLLRQLASQLTKCRHGALAGSSELYSGSLLGVPGPWIREFMDL